MTEKEKSFAGLLYQPQDPQLSAERDCTGKKLYDYNQLHPLDREREARQSARFLEKPGTTALWSSHFSVPMDTISP